MQHFKHFALVPIFVLFSMQTFGQVSLSNLKKAVNTNTSSIPTLFKGYKKEFTDKSGIVYFGNTQNLNTIAIDSKQGSNIVFYGFNSKTTFQQFYSEIDKISLENGCNIIEEIENRTILEASCECNGYFYFLKTLRYGNIVAGYEIKITKAENKKFIVKETKITNSKKNNEPITVHNPKPTSKVSFSGKGFTYLLADSVLFINYIRKNITESTLGDFTGRISFELHFSYGILNKVSFRQDNIPQEIRDTIETTLREVKKYQIKGFNLEKEKDFKLAFELIKKYY